MFLQSQAGIILWVWVLFVLVAAKHSHVRKGKVRSESSVQVMLDRFREHHTLDASDHGVESLAGIVKLEYKTCKPE